MSRPDRHQRDWPLIRVHPELRDDIDTLAERTGVSQVGLVGLALRMGLPRLKAELGLTTTPTEHAA